MVGRGQLLHRQLPELFYGGVHGDDARKVFDKLQKAVIDAITLYAQERKPLPEPITGRDFVNAMQRLA